MVWYVTFPAFHLQGTRRFRMANCVSTLFSPRKGGLLYSLDHAAFVTGRSSADVLTSANAMYAASVETALYYESDLLVVHSDPFLSIEAVGAKVEFPDKGPPILKTRPSVDAVNTTDIIHRGRFPLLMDVMKEVVRRFDGSDRVVSVSVTGPFTLAGCLLGEAEFLTRLKSGNDMVIQHVLSLATGIVMCFIDALIRTGSSVMVAEPLASLVRQDTFRNLVIPPLIRMRDMGDVFFHFCGETSHLIDAFLLLGPVSISLDIADLEPAVARTGNRIRYMGGLDSMLIFQGPERLITERISGLKVHFDPENLFICTGCDLIWNSPPRNGRLALNFIHGKNDCR